MRVKHEAGIMEQVGSGGGGVRLEAVEDEERQGGNV